MKFFIVLSTVVVCTLARPSYFHAPLTLPAAPIVAAPLQISSQYHAQDTLGQYSYGYTEPLSSKIESRSWDGTTRGGYTYVDVNGQLQSVQYTADGASGFRVSASNLPVAPDSQNQETPVPVKDTEEVAKAKVEHLAAVEEANKREESTASVSQAASFSSGTEEKQEEQEKQEASETEATDEGTEDVTEETEESDDSSSGSDTEENNTESNTASTGPVLAPVSYYTYAALAPALHYNAIVPTVHAYGYAPIVYHGLPLDTVRAQLKAKAVFSSRTIIH